MNENERRDRINNRLAEAGLSIESSGLRGTTEAWEKALGLTTIATTEEVPLPEGAVFVRTTADALRELTYEYGKRLLAAKGGKGAIDVNKWDETDAWFREQLTKGLVEGGQG